VSLSCASPDILPPALISTTNSSKIIDILICVICVIFGFFI
jgi:hypothetical protein